MGEIAKLFWIDGAQAVRLPEGWRLDGEAVQARREGAAIVLEPVPGTETWDWLQARVQPFDPDVEAALAEDVPQQGRSPSDLPE
ncbi:AbrB/MazE/SpoVT family DNA-binding domain-containing protein [uncultured Methylobacterium sp.]|jgi:antitoxin VapB|uniref:antitoxin n=1 Tax=uncultured Methylobacterium sp. TaxID=157278 RepID=UPI00263A2DB0|nr:AbrB/MazE/SpoVT family DNA-binding domain-containing protein [uncultured Methylobacterium sp.]